MARAAIGLGSNIEPRIGHLQAAVAKLASLGRLEAVSSLYETAPVGGPEQGPYLNAVALLETNLGPEDLLLGLQDIERQEGRTRTLRWGPRTLDLDLILYGNAVVRLPHLEVPHPRAHERAFVLMPLAEVWPEAHLPAGTAVEAAATIEEQEVEVVARHWIDDL